ncbi:MAG: sulfotransferase [Deltaproteobacteria bacterium]|nr:sulfotransferase [Deltaproteobacteria bacterium]
MTTTHSSLPLRVIFVLGAGRSGSTVLDTLLGNHPQAESVGELANLVRAYEANEYCACGKRCQDCPFWREVWSQWWSSGGDSLRYQELQRRFERPRAMVRSMVAKRAASPLFREYEEATRRCLTSVAEVSGQRVLVDSSKNPGRALALSRIDGIDLRLVHLVRDARGVAYSGAKAFTRDETQGLEQDIRSMAPRRTATSWLLANLVSSLVTRAVPVENRLLLRYEDLMADPRQALQALGRVTGLNCEPWVEAVEQGRALEVGHTVSGNRVRMKGKLRLKPDLEWLTHLSAADERTVRRLCGPLMRRYGYRLDAKESTSGQS